MSLFNNNDNFFEKLYSKELEKNYELKEENKKIKKELNFLKEYVNKNTKNKNNEYEKARKYLLGCLAFKDRRFTDIRIDVTGLFEVFNIPFDIIMPQFNKDGKRIYSYISVKLEIEDPRTIIDIKEIDIKNCINYELLNGI